MILCRCFPWDRAADPDGRGGPLWFPRWLQGDGRHDNPDLYGCLYLSEMEVAAVVEQLHWFAPQRRLAAWMLRQSGFPLALASIDVVDTALLVELDDPRVLVAEDLRPSLVATRNRERTQDDAARIFRRHRDGAGIRWWSTFESTWANVTVFDRAVPQLAVRDVRELTVFDPAVRDAAELIGLA